MAGNNQQSKQSKQSQQSQCGFCDRFHDTPKQCPFANVASRISMIGLKNH
jgi:hypothetical protein